MHRRESPEAMFVGSCTQYVQWILTGVRAGQDWIVRPSHPLDACVHDRTVAVDALGVDHQQDVHGVADALGDVLAWTPALSQSDTLACRRSYGRPPAVRQLVCGEPECPSLLPHPRVRRGRQRVAPRHGRPCSSTPNTAPDCRPAGARARPARAGRDRSTPVPVERTGRYRP